MTKTLVLLYVRVSQSVVPSVDSKIITEIIKTIKYILYVHVFKKGR